MPSVPRAASSRKRCAVARSRWSSCAISSSSGVRPLGVAFAAQARRYVEDMRAACRADSARRVSRSEYEASSTTAPCANMRSASSSSASMRLTRAAALVRERASFAQQRRHAVVGQAEERDAVRAGHRARAEDRVVDRRLRSRRRLRRNSASMRSLSVTSAGPVMPPVARIDVRRREREEQVAARRVRGRAGAREAHRRALGDVAQSAGCRAARRSRRR